MHSQVRWILSRQTALALVLVVVAGIAGGVDAALSAFAGGGIGVVANLLYALRAIRVPSAGGGKPDAALAYRGQLAGEAIKFAATLLGYALVFVGYKDVAPLWLFAGYASTFVIFWLALIRRR